MRALLICGCLALGGVNAYAGPAATPNWVELVGSPARAPSVRAARHKAFASGFEAVRSLARALGTAGGRAAAQGLADILDYRGKRLWGTFRVETLQAAAGIELRDARLMLSMRTCLTSQDVAIRAAAATALGRLGDSREVALLLRVARQEKRVVRKAAFRALGELTGASLPYSWARWHQWWRKHRQRVVPRIESAIAALESRADGDPLDAHRQVLLDEGWAHMQVIEPLLADWLVNIGPLRAEACALAAHFRLSDLGPAIERIAGGRLDRLAFNESARRALTVFGMANAP